MCSEWDYYIKLTEQFNDLLRRLEMDRQLNM